MSFDLVRLLEKLLHHWWNRVIPSFNKLLTGVKSNPLLLSVVGHSLLIREESYDLFLHHRCRLRGFAVTMSSEGLNAADYCILVPWIHRPYNKRQDNYAFVISTQKICKTYKTNIDTITEKQLFQRELKKHNSQASSSAPTHVPFQWDPLMWRHHVFSWIAFHFITDCSKVNASWKSGSMFISVTVSMLLPVPVPVSSCLCVHACLFVSVSVAIRRVRGGRSVPKDTLPGPTMVIIYR